MLREISNVNFTKSHGLKLRRIARISTLSAAVLAFVGAGPDTVRAQSESALSFAKNQSQRAEWRDRFDETVAEFEAINSSDPTLSPNTADLILQGIAKYQSIVASGGWPSVPVAKKALRVGTRHPNVVILRQRLMISGDLAQNTGSSDTFDSYVDAAVRRFQLRHGLIADGVVSTKTLAMLNVPADVRLRQLETNLVRVRSMSGFLGDSYVMVNIPAAEIEAVENGRVRSRHTAVVGKIDRQTPILSSKIHELNFNPYWHVPKSIIRKDLIPKMNEDPEYLARNKIRIFDWKGNELVKEQINWNTDEATQFLFKQDPGAENSMGSVKINFHNTHSVYLHDTPSKSLFGEDYRFHSSGCVRVQNVRELITWLLQSTTSDWNRARVDDVVRTGERLDVKLKTKVPIYMSYITAWSNAQGVVHFRDDIYKRDGEVQLEEFASAPAVVQ